MVFYAVALQPIRGCNINNEIFIDTRNPFELNQQIKTLVPGRRAPVVTFTEREKGKKQQYYCLVEYNKGEVAPLIE